MQQGARQASENKIEETTNFMAKLWNEKAPALTLCNWLVRVSGMKLHLQKMKLITRSTSQATVMTSSNAYSWIADPVDAHE